MSSESACEGVVVGLPEQQEECQLSVSDLLNSLHSVGHLWVERYFTDSPMATGAFMTLGSLLAFSPLMQFPCSPGLVDFELEADSAKVLLLE